jgi:ABC-2 type transport system ATP-binding protein
MTTSSPPAIAAVGLRKSYGDKVVLDGIDLTVPAGTIFSLLGPNGAGKTDGGQVRVAGHDLAREPDSVRAAIGVTGQFSAVDNLLTGEENLIAPGTAGLRCVTPGARARLLTPEPEQLPDWMGERRPRI